MKKTLMIFVILLSLLWTASVWAELKEGLWEITTRVEMKGMKGMPQSIPPTTVRQCITKSDPVPQNKDKNFECKTINLKTSGNTVSYTMECKGNGQVMQTSGTSTYTGSSMDGTTTTSIKMKGQPEMKMASKTYGKYIGACTK
jgi:hypothetical protein